MKILLLFLMIVNLGFTSDTTKCFKYNPQDFNLQYLRYITYEKTQTTKANLEDLKMYYIYKEDKLKTVTVEYKINGYIYYNADVWCDFDNKNMCGIEDDGGTMVYDENYTIKKSDLSIFRLDEVTKGVQKRLYTTKNREAKAEKIECPKNIPVGKSYEERYKDHKEGKYVCYSRFECTKNIKSCASINRGYFGHYGTTQETQKALKRCKLSKPYVNKDNKQGHYVCFNYLDYNRLYVGCFRSIKSCKTISKKHFGKYSSTINSKKALYRCINSLPKK